MPQVAPRVLTMKVPDLFDAVDDATIRLSTWTVYLYNKGRWNPIRNTSAKEELPGKVWNSWPESTA